MIYRGVSWSCILFGLFLFWSSYQIVPFQQTAPEIISVLLFGLMGAVIAGNIVVIRLQLFGCKMQPFFMQPLCVTISMTYRLGCIGCKLK